MWEKLIYFCVYNVIEFLYSNIWGVMFLWIFYLEWDSDCIIFYFEWFFWLFYLYNIFVICVMWVVIKFCNFVIICVIVSVYKYLVEGWLKIFVYFFIKKDVFNIFELKVKVLCY